MIDLTKGRFIKLTNDKKPLEKFDKNYSYAEIIAADTENVGLLMEQDFLVIDLDIEEEAYSLLHYINEYKINCDVMQTTRGLHFWFRSKESLRLNTGIQNALSFKCDIRC
jgi:putative DNA primase/helicase